jgi:Concanavalin A-like lectin/glucanases superfamily
MLARVASVLLLAASSCNPNVVDAVTEPSAEPPPTMPTTAPTGTVPEPPPANPLATTLLHRYSFGGEGEVVIDAIGAAHGAAVGAELDGSGQLVLAGGSTGQHVDLPDTIISGLTAATLEAWVTWSGGGRWQRIFDFGASTAGPGLPGADGTSYLFLTAQAGDNTRGYGAGALRAAYSLDGTDDEDTCQAPAPLPEGVPTHVALVIDPTLELMALYQDGVLVKECAFARPLALIDDNNCWLGRSNYIKDVAFAGSFDEFRMYKAALDADQIAESFKAGPDAAP